MEDGLLSPGVGTLQQSAEAIGSGGSGKVGQGERCLGLWVCIGAFFLQGCNLLFNTFHLDEMWERSTIRSKSRIHWTVILMEATALNGARAGQPGGNAEFRDSVRSDHIWKSSSSQSGFFWQILALWQSQEGRAGEIPIFMWHSNLFQEPHHCSWAGGPERGKVWSRNPPADTQRGRSTWTSFLDTLLPSKAERVQFKAGLAQAHSIPTFKTAPTSTLPSAKSNDARTEQTLKRENSIKSLPEENAPLA